MDRYCPIFSWFAHRSLWIVEISDSLKRENSVSTWCFCSGDFEEMSAKKLKKSAVSIGAELSKIESAKTYIYECKTKMVKSALNILHKLIAVLNRKINHSKNSLRDLSTKTPSQLIDNISVYSY